MKHYYKFLLILFLAAISFNGIAQLNVSTIPETSWTMCVGMQEQFQATATGGNTPYHYQWSPSLWLNNDTIHNPMCSPIYTFSHDTLIVYSVIVTDSIGAKDTATIILQLISAPNFHITSTAQNDSICSGMSTMLTAHGASNYSYEWPYYMGGLSSDTGTSVIATPIASTNYMVFASNNGCTSSTSFNIYVSNCSYNILHGTVYNDINANGTRDAGEYFMPHFMANITPADSVFSYIYGSTYTAYIGQGNFNVTPDNAPYYTQTSDPNITFSGYTTEDTLDIGLHGIPGITDIKVNITQCFYQYYCHTENCASIFSWCWPYNIEGGVGSYIIHYRNVGTDTLNAVLKIKFDSLFDNFGTISASINGDTVLSVINDTLIWEYHNLMPSEDRYFYAGGLDTNAVIGEIHQVSVIGYPLISDTVPANNYDTCYQLVLGSWDPNFKEVKPNSDLTITQITAGTPLTYTVHFQNTGNDTAYIVKVRDTISQKLNMATFEMISASHTYSIKISEGNNIELTFNNIMLPDSGANQILSNGYLKYRITPYPNLNTSDSIVNNAAIYFDNNAPVITNNTITRIILTAVNEINEETSDFIVYPNPTSGDFIITVPPFTKQIKITNSLGQTLQRTIVDRQTSLNFKIKETGIYFIQVTTDKQTVTKKLIVAK